MRILRNVTACCGIITKKTPTFWKRRRFGSGTAKIIVEVKE